MNLKLRIALGCCLLSLIDVLTTAAWGQGKPAAPTPAEELRAIAGKWHLLLAHEADRNLLDQSEYQNSQVTISDKQLLWHSADGKLLFSGACNWKHVGRPSWEIDLTQAENEPAFPGVAVLFDQDVLKISWRRKNLDKGRTANFNGNQDHTLLLLSRKPTGKLTGKASLLGQWQMLTALDDSLDKLGSGRTTAVAVFEADSFAWKAAPNDRQTKYSGGYVLDDSAKPARIKFNIKFPPPGSGATPTPKDGLVPGIFEFLDDDTVRLCYRESGWKSTDPPEARQFPESFYSDGNLNLWILRRVKP